MPQMLDDAVEGPASLPSLGQRVEEAFQQLLAKISPEDTVAWEHESIRFALWAENLGVHHHGHSSLEYRVREAEPVRRLIASLIQDLLDCIGECRLPSSPSASSTKSDDDDGHDSDEYLDDYEDESQLTSSLRSAGDIINRLYRLSTKIRNPGTRLAPTKAYNYSIIDRDTGIDLVDEWANADTKHIEELLWDFRTDDSIPYTTTDDPVRDRRHRPRNLDDNDLTLLRRLAKANTLRRKQFGQWRRHQDKVNHENARARRQRNDLPLHRAGARSITGHTVAPSDVLEPAQTSTTVSRPTTATLLPTFELKDFDTAVSTTSSRTTAPYAEGTEDDVAEVPPLPPSLTKERYFICPYCFLVCSKSSTSPKQWREHVLRDLRPYTCTYAECSTGDQLYDDYKSWSAHELNYHNRIWKCPDHPDELFNDAKPFRRHLSMCQGYDPADSRLDALVTASTTVAQASGRPCPFCGIETDNMSSMQSHIAIHQQRVALFALPNSTGLEEGSDVGSDEADAGHVSEESDMSKNLEAWNTLDNDVATLDDNLDVDFSVLLNLRVEHGGGLFASNYAHEMVGQALATSTRDPESYTGHLVDANGNILDNESGSVIGSAGIWPRNLCVLARFDHKVGNDDSLLDFDSGNVVGVLCQAPSGWWYGARDGFRGWFPSKYTSLAPNTATVSPEVENAINSRSMVSVAQPIRVPSTWASGFGISGFFTACINGQAGDVNDVKKYLRERPEMTDWLHRSGDTALHLAAERGHIDMVRLLLTHGAEVDIFNDIQATPLMCAVENGQLEVVRELLSNGADARLQDNRGFTPLHVAAKRGYIGIVLLLLEQGAEVDIRSDFQSTPLMGAVEKAQVEVVRELLSNGADAQLRDSRGHVAFHFVPPDTPGGPKVQGTIRQLLIQSVTGQPNERYVRDEIDKAMKIKLGTENMLRALEGKTIRKTKDRKQQLEQELEAYNKKLAELYLELEQETQGVSKSNSFVPEDYWTDTKFDAVVDRATSNEAEVGTLHRPQTSEIQAILNSGLVPEAYCALVSAMKKRLTANTVLALGNTTRAIRTLDLATALGEDCGQSMRRELSGGSWMDTLCSITENMNVRSEVKAAVLEHMRQWSVDFARDTDVSLIVEALRKLDDGPLKPDYVANEAEYESRPLPPLPAASKSSGQVTETTDVVAPSSLDSRAGLYPWSRWSLLGATFAESNPFPRYGAGVNASTGKEGEIYIFGGLVDESTIKADLWRLDTASRKSTPLRQMSEGPGPRVGHAALLAGNAFIVSFGDTKVGDSERLDTTLYLLRTSSRQWSRTKPSITPPPRYGHSMCLLGSYLYIFGGQQEGIMYNDTWAFDLNKLQDVSNQWEQQCRTSRLPPRRTNHTAVVYKDEMWIFGGTDGVTWYSDIWRYSPQTDEWVSMDDAIGYIPVPREGHSIAVVGDVMYVFGGRSEEGIDLGDLAAYRFPPHNRWYKFQNMGISPSPRSGHTMTVGSGGATIIVMGGEPSKATRDRTELQMFYELDTRKIRYPSDSTTKETLQVPPPGENRTVSTLAAHRLIDEAIDRGWDSEETKPHRQSKTITGRVRNLLRRRARDEDAE